MKDYINIEYERALLGTIIFDNRILDEYEIKDNLFAAPQSKKIWGVIKELRAAGAAVTLMDIGHKIPPAEIVDITDYANIVNCKMYFSELKEFAKMRELKNLFRRGASMFADDESYDSITDYIDRTLSDIDSMRESGYTHVGEHAHDVIHHIQKLYDNRGKLSGVDTGFGKLDEMTNGWQAQDYIVIGARPSTGKTAGMLNLATAALRHGKNVGIFSAEMNIRSILLRMVSDWGNVDSSKMRSGFLRPVDIMAAGEAAAAIGKTGLYINDTPNIQFSALVSDARRMRRKEKVDIIFIDYMGLVTSEKNNLARHEQVSEISKNLKGLTRELNIPIVVLSQLKRESHGSQPTLADLRESGSIEQDADLVILLQDMGQLESDETCKKIRWHIAKQRNGQIGTIDMIFKGAYMRMKESETQWEETKKETRGYRK